MDFVSKKKQNEICTGIQQADIVIIHGPTGSGKSFVLESAARKNNIQIEYCESNLENINFYNKKISAKMDFSNKADLKKFLSKLKIVQNKIFIETTDFLSYKEIESIVNEQHIFQKITLDENKFENDSNLNRYYNKSISKSKNGQYDSNKCLQHKKYILKSSDSFFSSGSNLTEKPSSNNKKTWKSLKKFTTQKPKTDQNTFFSESRSDFSNNTYNINPLSLFSHEISYKSEENKINSIEHNKNMNKSYNNHSDKNGHAIYSNDCSKIDNTQIESLFHRRKLQNFVQNTISFQSQSENKYLFSEDIMKENNHYCFTPIKYKCFQDEKVLKRQNPKTKSKFLDNIVAKSHSNDLLKIKLNSYSEKHDLKNINNYLQNKFFDQNVIKNNEELGTADSQDYLLKYRRDICEENHALVYKKKSFSSKSLPFQKKSISIVKKSKRKYKSGIIRNRVSNNFNTKNYQEEKLLKIFQRRKFCIEDSFEETFSEINEQKRFDIIGDNEFSENRAEKKFQNTNKSLSNTKRDVIIYNSDSESNKSKTTKNYQFTKVYRNSCIFEKDFHKKNFLFRDLLDKNQNNSKGNLIYLKSAVTVKRRISRILSESEEEVKYFSKKTHFHKHKKEKIKDFTKKLKKNDIPMKKFHFNLMKKFIKVLSCTKNTISNQYFLKNIEICIIDHFFKNFSFLIDQRFRFYPLVIHYNKNDHIYQQMVNYIIINVLESNNNRVSYFRKMICNQLYACFKKTQRYFVSSKNSNNLELKTCCNITGKNTSITFSSLELHKVYIFVIHIIFNLTGIVKKHLILQDGYFLSSKTIILFYELNSDEIHIFISNQRVSDVYSYEIPTMYTFHNKFFFMDLEIMAIICIYCLHSIYYNNKQIFSAFYCASFHNYSALIHIFFLSKFYKKDLLINSNSFFQLPLNENHIYFREDPQTKILDLNAFNLGFEHNLIKSHKFTIKSLIKNKSYDFPYFLRKNKSFQNKKLQLKFYQNNLYKIMEYYFHRNSSIYGENFLKIYPNMLELEERRSKENQNHNDSIQDDSNSDTLVECVFNHDDQFICSLESFEISKIFSSESETEKNHYNHQIENTNMDLLSLDLGNLDSNLFTSSYKFERISELNDSILEDLELSTNIYSQNSKKLKGVHKCNFHEIKRKIGTYNIMSKIHNHINQTELGMNNYFCTPQSIKKKRNKEKKYLSGSKSHTQRVQIHTDSQSICQSPNQINSEMEMTKTQKYDYKNKIINYEKNQKKSEMRMIDTQKYNYQNKIINYDKDHKEFNVLKVYIVQINEPTKKTLFKNFGFYLPTGNLCAYFFKKEFGMDGYTDFSPEFYHILGKIFYDKIDWANIFSLFNMNESFFHDFATSENLKIKSLVFTKFLCCWQIYTNKNDIDLSEREYVVNNESEDSDLIIKRRFSNQFKKMKYVYNEIVSNESSIKTHEAFIETPHHKIHGNKYFQNIKYSSKQDILNIFERFKQIKNFTSKNDSYKLLNYIHENMCDFFSFDALFELFRFQSQYDILRYLREDYKMIPIYNTFITTISCSKKFRNFRSPYKICTKKKDLQIFYRLF